MGQLRTCQNGKKDIHHVFFNGFPLKSPSSGGKSSFGEIWEMQVS